ncbi:thiopurine S-methyltransferase [Romeria aff. gracilis LEGE 07310]|uniref:thiopurine S-methyltransferase n=1 Tax=Vasconcelosia minhoensis LEGE 07310 TaxID=915328 RepID=A0A8J7A8Y4_9CYAN|nr:thiopurine S-methyltransferase [Romeria gracilis]MBE9079442.1 thiopurine S-methyltransferase [Romeria aff. gracilis LEGE 07310]
MHIQFWVDSWNAGGHKTSFHRQDVHPYVLKYLTPEVLRDKRVLVPLCGKSVDMIYFREHAAQVIGVELVEKAILEFFAEHQIPFTRRGARFEADRLTIICNNFFSLNRVDIGPIDWIYDRAALVALPLPLRQQYVCQVDKLLPVGGQQFVNTLEYFPRLETPPFSIAPDEVAAYYCGNHSICHLEQPTLPGHGMVRKFGLNFLKEHGFLLTKCSETAIS